MESTGMSSNSPTTTMGTRQWTKAHGIRVTWHGLPSEVYVLDWFGLFESLMEMVVMFLLWSVAVVQCVGGSARSNGKRRMGAVAVGKSIEPTQSGERDPAVTDEASTNIRVRPVTRTGERETERRREADKQNMSSQLEVKTEEPQEEARQRSSRLAPIATPEERLRILQGMKKKRDDNRGSELTGTKKPGLLTGVHVPRRGGKTGNPEHPDGSLFA